MGIKTSFFLMRSGRFLSIEKTISRVSKLYPLLFEIKILIVSQLGKCPPLPLLGQLF